jgi:hypothetical protein
MKKITILGTILIMLAFLVVPAMAKSPFTGNDSGNPGKGNNPTVTEEAPGHGNGNAHQNQNANANQHSQQNQEKHANGNQNSSRVRTPFYLQGTISSIDATDMTITVTLTHGNARVKEYLGSQLSLQASDATQIYKIDQTEQDGSETGASNTPSDSENENGEEGPNRVAITFDQLAAGDIVAIHGNLVDGIYNARLVTVYVRAPEGEPVGGTSDSGG